MATKARARGDRSVHGLEVAEPPAPYEPESQEAKPKPKSNRVATEPVRAKQSPASSRTAFPAGVLDIITSMRSGALGGAIIPEVAHRIGVSQERLFKELRLPRSTMKARIANNTSLSAIEQDRIYRAEKVLQRAQAVFEDVPAARIWITRDNRSLGGVSPLSLLDTEAGYELVLDTLGRIEYGVIS